VAAVLRLFLILPLLPLLAACERQPPEPLLELEAVTFEALEGWREDDPRPALAALLRSCAVFARRPDARALGGDPRFGTYGLWKGICAEARTLAHAAGAEEVRRFFETRFRPWRVSDRGDAEGLFTGYYEPLLHGARRPSERYRYPIYRRPPELVMVDLGRFVPELRGRRIAGRLDGGWLEPFADRATIERGLLAGRGLEIAWVDDPIALFFLHIQGSGRIRFEDGTSIRVGYDGWNGHPYRAIGRDLVEMREIPREEISLFSIRTWLQAHPERARELMNRNPSYVFFRVLEGLDEAEGPLGSLGVPLTPGRSLAVDRRFIPLGLPLWLETTAPYPDGPRPLRRLVVAQDTGGAIRGVVRGDLFWGDGARAEYLAGHMKSRGRYYLLLPRRREPVS